MIVELFSLHFSINVMNWIGNLDWRTKRSREELPHIWGQGQKLGGPHAQWAAAKRSYPTSEVRGSGRECQAVTVQERLRGATPCPRPRAAAERSHPASTTKARDGGQEDPPHLWGQGRWREEQPHVQGVVAVRAQEGLEEPSHVEGQEGWRWGDTPHPR